MRPTARLALQGLIALAPCAVQAQHSLRGVLHDSLVTARPIAGATVMLLGTGSRTATDRRGRFKFDGVSPGTHRVAYSEPWLDSLGLPPLIGTIVIGANGQGDEMHLSTPSLGTLALERCGGGIEPGYGVLVGEIRGIDGVPAEGAVVLAEWWETRLGIGMNDRVTLRLVDSVSASGRFALCGVPLDAETRVRADSPDGRRTGDLLYISRATVSARDLVVADPAARLTITGAAQRPDGQALVDAEVLLVGDTTVVGRTDASGRYTVTGPWSSAQLVVRSIGLTPAVIDFLPTDSHLELPPVRLERAPQLLPTVTSTGRLMTLEELAFEHRRSLGMGTFVDEATLSKIPVISPAVVSSFTMKLYYLDGVLKMRYAYRFCVPRIFVDGNPEPYENLRDVLSRAKRLEIYRAAVAPPRFTDFNGCGAIVVWTR